MTSKYPNPTPVITICSCQVLVIFSEVITLGRSTASYKQIKHWQCLIKSHYPQLFRGYVFFHIHTSKQHYLGRFKLEGLSFQQGMVIVWHILNLKDSRPKSLHLSQTRYKYPMTKLFGTSPKLQVDLCTLTEQSNDILNLMRPKDALHNQTI